MFGGVKGVGEKSRECKKAVFVPIIPSCKGFCKVLWCAFTLHSSHPPCSSHSA